MVSEAAIQLPVGSFGNVDLLFLAMQTKHKTAHTLSLWFVVELENHHFSCLSECPRCLYSTGYMETPYQGVWHAFSDESELIHNQIGSYELCH
jgi:hypothetical protein